MVATRTQTNSLPEKKPTFAETQFAAIKTERSTNITKPRRRLAVVWCTQCNVRVPRRDHPQCPSCKKVFGRVQEADPHDETEDDEERNPRCRCDTEYACLVHRQVREMSANHMDAPLQRTSTKVESESSNPSTGVGHDLSTTLLRQTATSPLTQSASFLDLPAEVRNEIYAYALVTVGKVLIHPVKPFVLEPPLLRVNRLVRFEALPIFYSENVFQVAGSSPGVQFMRSISDQRLQSLQALEIHCTLVPAVDYARERIKQLLREFGGRGMRRSAIRFQVSVDNELMWANLEQLKSLS